MVNNQHKYFPPLGQINIIKDVHALVANTYILFLDDSICEKMVYHVHLFLPQGNFTSLKRKSTVYTTRSPLVLLM
jgi:hypothetical protein